MRGARAVACCVAAHDGCCVAWCIRGVVVREGKRAKAVQSNLVAKVASRIQPKVPKHRRRSAQPGARRAAAQETLGRGTIAPPTPHGHTREPMREPQSRATRHSGIHPSTLYPHYYYYYYYIGGAQSLSSFLDWPLENPRSQTTHQCKEFKFSVLPFASILSAAAEKTHAKRPPHFPTISGLAYLISGVALLVRVK